jgi:hypothetical protein
LAGSQPAFFMSHMLQDIPVCFQWLSLTGGGSTRHTRNMDRAEYVAQESAYLKREWDAGNHLPDLYKAVEFCQAAEIPLFDWCAIAVLNLIIATYNGDRPGGPGKRGRYEAPRAKFKNYFRHLRRWQVVHAELRKRDLTLENIRRPQGRLSAKEKEKAAKVEDAIQAARNRLKEATDPRDGASKLQLLDSCLRIEEWRTRGDTTLASVLRNSPSIRNLKDF